MDHFNNKKKVDEDDYYAVWVALFIWILLALSKI
jgi:hypothetical protein